MLQFTSQQIKQDPILTKISDVLMENHTLQQTTIANTLLNKDLTEHSRCFAVLMNRTLFVHYDIKSYWTPDGISVDLESIGVYESFLEFESARVKELHSAKHKNIPNIN